MFKAVLPGGLHRAVEAEVGMLVVETIAKIRRAYFVDGRRPIKAICRELGVSRKFAGGVTASTIYMRRRSTPPCSRKSAVPAVIFGSLASSNGARPIDWAEA
jgi:hypothetical protein